MNSRTSRQPQGTPTQGQFAASAHTESGVALPDPADRTIALAPSESENSTECSARDLITRLPVLRSDNHRTFHVEAPKLLNPKDIIPAPDPGTDETGRDAWPNTHVTVIENYLHNRSQAEPDTNHREDVLTECGVSIQADEVTGKQAADAAWNRSGIVASLACLLKSGSVVRDAG